MPEGRPPSTVNEAFRSFLETHILTTGFSMVCLVNLPGASCYLILRYLWYPWQSLTVQPRPNAAHPPVLKTLSLSPSWCPELDWSNSSVSPPGPVTACIPTDCNVIHLILAPHCSLLPLCRGSPIATSPEDFKIWWTPTTRLVAMLGGLESMEWCPGLKSSAKHSHAIWGPWSLGQMLLTLHWHYYLHRGCFMF